MIISMAENHVCRTLHDASGEGHHQCIQILLSNGHTQLNEKNNDGWTPHATFPTLTLP
jgi:hypothetical protein